MKHKLLAYSFIPVLGLGVLGAGIASAHGFFGNFGGLNPNQVVTRYQQMFQNEANILGVSVDEVKAAWAQGKTIKQLMQEKGISQEQMRSRIQDLQAQQIKSQLQVLVDKGVITQAQADQRLQIMKTRTQNAKVGGRMGMMGRYGWFRF